MDGEQENAQAPREARQTPAGHCDASPRRTLQKAATSPPWTASRYGQESGDAARRAPSPLQAVPFPGLGEVERILVDRVHVEVSSSGTLGGSSAASCASTACSSKPQRSSSQRGAARLAAVGVPCQEAPAGDSGGAGYGPFWGRRGAASPPQADVVFRRASSPPRAGSPLRAFGGSSPPPRAASPRGPCRPWNASTAVPLSPRMESLRASGARASSPTPQRRQSLEVVPDAEIRAVAERVLRQDVTPGLIRKLDRRQLVSLLNARRQCEAPAGTTLRGRIFDPKEVAAAARATSPRGSPNDSAKVMGLRSGSPEPLSPRGSLLGNRRATSPRSSVASRQEWQDTVSDVVDYFGRGGQSCGRSALREIDSILCREH